MKGVLICVMLMLLNVSISNTKRSLRSFNPENRIFLITLDGFRWEEVFMGADSALLHDPRNTPDPSVREAFWAAEEEERRKRLLPFFWNNMALQGQLFGNRNYDNKVNISNPYALSYPGYNELLTGSADISIYSNSRIRNSNRNILGLIHSTPEFRGRVAAFTSWDAFPFILGKEREFYLNSGVSRRQGPDRKKIHTSAIQTYGNAIRDDLLTFRAAKEYILQKNPSVVFLSFSGTDNAGHEGRYDHYLKQAHRADSMIAALWELTQTHPYYAGRTTFVITTDHGRGNKKATWSRHGFLVSGSSRTWFALLGNGVVPAGEMRTRNQAYQKDIKSLVFRFLTMAEPASDFNLKTY